MYRSALVTLIVAVWLSPAFAQDATVAGVEGETDSPPVRQVEVVNFPAGPPRFEFVGVTTATFDGSGNGGGWLAMTRACADEFPGSRMAFSDELMGSVDPPSVSDAAWINPRISVLSVIDNRLALASDPHGNLMESLLGTLNCYGWRANSAPVRGGHLRPGGSIHTETCTNSFAVACAAPVQ